VDAYITRHGGPENPKVLVIKGRQFVADIFLAAFGVRVGLPTTVPVPESWLLAAGRIVANKTSCPR